MKPKVRGFEEGWALMVKDLENSQTFTTTGGRTSFEVWSKGDHVYYGKSTGNVCSLSKSDFKKAHGIYRETGSLKTSDYRITMHGSYVPPLLEKYFKL